MRKIKIHMPGDGRKKQDHGLKSEKRASHRLDAILRPGSGALDGAKGDMLVHEFLVESKSTVKDSLSLKYSYLCKIAQEAAEQAHYPALIVQFVTPNGRIKNDGGWVMIPERLFKRIAQVADK